MKFIDRVRSLVEVAKVFWYWTLIIGVFASVALLARACNSEREAKSELLKVQQAAAIERAGFIVARTANDSDREELARSNNALKGEIDRLEELLGQKPKVITVEKIVTGPSVADGSPRQVPMVGSCPTCSECLLSRGDKGEIRVHSARIQTDEGNQVVALSAEAWRLTPDKSIILSGTASAPLSVALSEAQKAPPGWGYGALAGVGSDGVIGSAIAMSPPFIWQLSGIGILTAGPEYASLQLGLIWR